MRSFFGNLILRLRIRRAVSSRKDFHLPDDLTSPDYVVVVCGDSEEDVWPAMYLTESVRSHYRSAQTWVVCTERDRPLFSKNLPQERMAVYAEEPSEALEKLEDTRDGRSIAFFPYLSISLSQALFLAKMRSSVSVGPLEHPAVGISVRLETECRMPEMIHSICEVLHVKPRREYRPSISRSEMARAATVLAPVSGRAMPFVACTEGVKRIMRETNAEVPLKTVVLKGGDPDLDLPDRSLFLAVLSSASVVLTDDPGMWGDACALGIPVVGLDESGTFPKWQTEAESSREGFLERWTGFLKEGW
jgi:hypothetical protein